MKKFPSLGALILLAASLPANASPQEDVAAAAKKLGEQSNYSWTATTVSPSGGFTPGPLTGKTEKDGVTFVTSSFGDNAFEIALKGDKGAVKGQDGWQSLAEIEQAEGPGRFLAVVARTTKIPAPTATDLAAHTAALKLVDGTYVSDLTTEGAKAQLAFGGPDEPAVANPKGSVKFWLKDGLLAKYELKLQASMNFNGNDFPIDQITTVEIKDVDTTKVELPADAKKKIP